MMVTWPHDGISIHVCGPEDGIRGRLPRLPLSTHKPGSDFSGTLQVAAPVRGTSCEGLACAGTLSPTMKENLPLPCYNIVSHHVSSPVVSILPPISFMPPMRDLIRKPWLRELNSLLRIVPWVSGRAGMQSTVIFPKPGFSTACYTLPSPGGITEKEDGSSSLWAVMLVKLQRTNLPRAWYESLPGLALLSSG